MLKPVLGFKDYYVSSAGHVYSTKKGVLRPLSPQKDRNGYLTVYLYQDGKRVFKTIHRLVVSHFLKRNGKPQINHKDGDKTNNHWRNLEEVTCSENVEHAYRGVRAHECHKVLQLKDGNIVAAYDSINQAAKLSGVSKGGIHQCLKQISTQSGGFNWEYS